MKTIVQFNISKDEDGVYIAEGTNVPVVTDAKSLDELVENIKEATELYFEGEDPADFGFVKSPSLFVNFELQGLVHA